MNIVTVASPDKLSISLVVSFLRHCLGKEYIVSSMNSLMDKDNCSKYIDSVMTKYDKILIGYYAKRKINMDPLVVLPGRLIEVSSLVVWLELYSMDWKVLKDEYGVSAGYVDRWKRNLDKASTD